MKIGSLEVLFSLQLKRMNLLPFTCRKTVAKMCFFSCLIIKFDCLLNSEKNVLRELEIPRLPLSSPSPNSPSPHSMSYKLTQGIKCAGNFLPSVQLLYTQLYTQGRMKIGTLFITCTKIFTQYYVSYYQQCADWLMIIWQPIRSNIIALSACTHLYE